MNPSTDPSPQRPQVAQQIHFDWDAAGLVDPAAGTSYHAYGFADRFINTLDAWCAGRVDAVLHFVQSQGSAKEISFDRADPAFPPLEAIPATIAQASTAKPEIYRRYILSNDSFNPLMFSEYVEHLGIRVPLSVGGRTVDSFGREHLVTGLGATQLYNLALSALLKENDIFLITAPTYGLFAIQPLLKNVRFVTLRLNAEDDWKINPDKLESLLTETEHRYGKVKAFLHINPNNPMGSIESKDDLAKIVPILIRHDIFTIDDLAYHGLELGKERACALASFEGMEE